MNAMGSHFDFRGMRVTVMGLGHFGGGAAAVRFLADRGAQITVTDLQSEEDLALSLADLEGCALEAVHLGCHREEDFLQADLIVASPAVPRDNRFLDLARRWGVPVSSEMNLFWQHNRGRTIGVTGSNGKSTTAALIHSILKASGVKGRLGGNIGTSLLPVVEDIEPDEWIVLELSSFQLEDLNSLPASPNIAVVTNFTPNHLDWHGSLADYRRAKQAILRWQTPECAAVLNQDDVDVASWSSYGRQFWFGLSDSGRCGLFAQGSGGCILRTEHEEHRLDICDWLKLPGRHNLQNAMAAACAALAAGVDHAAIQRGLENFVPLPHRLEPVGEVAGRRFYNDSLATTPESTAWAVAAFSEPIVLLAGGYDKQIDLTHMAEAVAGKVKAVALMGQTAEYLEDLIEIHDIDNSVAVDRCECFDDAFARAWEQSVPGDIILLSPGCASYDWFTNFAERGERFVELVDQCRKTTGQ